MYNARICRYNSIDLIEDITPQERCLLYRLNGLSNENGECYPSIETMAKDLKVSATSIHRYIKALMNKGFISIQPRIKENGKQTSNLYKLTLPKVKNNLQEKIEELKETVKTMAKDTLPQMAPKRNNNKYNNKYNSKSNREIEADIPVLKEVEEDKSIMQGLNKEYYALVKKIFRAIVCNKSKTYNIYGNNITRADLIAKISRYTSLDIKALVNAISQRKEPIKNEYGYIVKVVWNGIFKEQNTKEKNTEPNFRLSSWNIEQQDYNFDLLEKVGTKGYI